MYLGGKNNIVRDDLFIVKNIEIYNNMYDSEFKGLIYKYFQKHLSRIKQFILKTSMANTLIGRFSMNYLISLD